MRPIVDARDTEHVQGNDDGEQYATCQPTGFQALKHLHYRTALGASRRLPD